MTRQSWFITVAGVLVGGCAVHPPLTLGEFGNRAAHGTWRPPEVCAVTGFGDVSLTRGGERFRGVFSVRWHRDSSFEGMIYTTLGIRLLSVRSHGPEIVIETGEKRLEVSREGTTDHIPFFGRFTAPAELLIQIMSGTVRIPHGKPGIINETGRAIAGEWHGRDSRIRVEVLKKKRAVARIVCRPLKGEGWEARLSEFRRGWARRIEIRMGERDSLLFSYKKGECSPCSSPRQ